MKRRREREDQAGQPVAAALQPYCNPYGAELSGWLPKRFSFMDASPWDKNPSWAKVVPAMPGRVWRSSAIPLPFLQQGGASWDGTIEPDAVAFYCEARRARMTIRSAACDPWRRRLLPCWSARCGARGQILLRPSMPARPAFHSGGLRG